MKFKTLQVLIFFIIGTIFLSGISNAEQKTIVKEYSYQAGEQDSKASSRIMAMAQIKRLVLEEAGTYIAGTAVVKGLQLESDQVNAMTAGIVGLKVIDESWDGKVFYMKAEATIDPDDIAKKLENMAQNQNQIGELENAQQKIDALQAEVESLKADMHAMQNQAQQTDQTANNSPQPAPDQAVQQDYAARYNAAVNQMGSLDMVQNSYVDINSGHYYKALDTLNNAVILSPQAAPAAYIATSIVYVNLNLPLEALAYLNKAVRLNQEIETRAILTKAFVYERSGDNNLALEEVNRAIRVDPREPWAYRLRARLYIQRGSKAMALADIRKARKLYKVRRLAIIKAGPAAQETSTVITITNSSLNSVGEKPAPGLRSREKVRQEQEKHEKKRLEGGKVEKEKNVKEQQHPTKQQQERQIRMAEIRQQRLHKLQQDKKQEREREKQADRERLRQKKDQKHKTQQKKSK